MRSAVRPTILHLTAPASVGGLETVVLDLTRGLHARGIRTVLGAVLDTPGSNAPLPRRATALGLEVAPLVIPPRAYLREYRAITHLISESAPDIVHTHGYRADLLGGWAARQAQLPWIATAHGFIGGGVKARLYEWLQVRALRGATRVLAVSRLVQERLEREGVPSDRITLVRNAWLPKPLLSRVEARRRLGIPDAELVAGWVGRLTPEKGTDVFLEALAATRDPRWSGSIIGGGPDRDGLEQLATALGIASRVRWHGEIQDAATVYAAFDAWVLSSRTEGTPMALFEAMEARVPVVATRVGGVPDVVSGAEAALVLPERPRELAAALDALLADPSRATGRAQAAHQRLREAFGHEAWVDAHLAIYVGATSVR